MTPTLIIIGLLFLLAGIIGCVIPGIPGPPLAYLSLVFIQFADKSTFTLSFLLLWAIIVIGVTLLDYFVPAWGTKKFGGSKYGMWGSIIGLITGLFMGPWGIIIGPFLGAYLGELIGGMNNTSALKAGFGSFIGFAAGTLMKLTVSLIIAYYFFTRSWELISF